MGDCHSFDPGSKFGLKKPNGHPGPGAAYTFLNISNSNLGNLQQIGGYRDSPPSQTGLHTTQKPWLNSCPLQLENEDAIISPLVENNRTHVGNSDKNPLTLANAVKTKSSKIDKYGFRKYLLAQGKRNWKQILQKATKHGHILETKDASEILTFSNTKRRHVMEALVCLSKYQGTYNT